ncbi:MAG: type II methionyl aminopeptidase [Candidatus Woesearchaeota archaeon]
MEEVSHVGEHFSSPKNSDVNDLAHKYSDWIVAGRIAAQVREFSKPLISKGASILEIADKIEAKIRELGAKPAFPVNLSINDVAAHYTPVMDDPLVLDDQVIKVDIGVVYNGAIGDTAYTVDISGKYSDLVRASEEALNNVVREIHPDITLGEIGRIIQETIQSYGYSPIRNLCGHGLGINSVHQKPSIPNYDSGDVSKLKIGSCFAIEPFATNGRGLIKESIGAMIFSQIASKPVRSQNARQLFSDIYKYNGLPFATRWFKDTYTEAKLNLGLRELRLAGNIRDYPPLTEISKGIVSQAEHSFFVAEDKIIVLTK